MESDLWLLMGTAHATWASPCWPTDGSYPTTGTSTKPLNILSAASATKDTVLNNLPTAIVTDLYRTVMFPALWAAAEANGINPVGMIAQSGKETGWGSYRGR